MRNLYFRISTFYSLISTKHTAINKILTPHGLSVIGGNKRQKVKILKFRMWFKYGLGASALYLCFTLRPAIFNSATRR